MAYDKLKKLMADVMKLPPKSKLHVAIGLLDRNMPDRAEMLIEAALTQLRAEKLMGADTYKRLTENELSKL